MEFIKSIDAKTSDLVMKVIYKYYSYFLQLGVAFLNLRPKWWRLSILQLVIYFLITFYFGIILAITTAQLADDKNAASQSAYLTTAVIVTIIAMINFTVKRDAIVELMTIVGNDYYQYSDSFKSVKVEKWKSNFDKMKLIVTITIPIYLSSVLCLVTFIAPWIDELQGYKPKDFVNGVYMKLPLPMWFPYTINNYTLHLLTIASILIIGLIVASVIFAAILILIFQSQELNLQMIILSDSIKHIEDRAAELYQTHFGKLNVKNKKDKKYSKILNNCIKENVEHHKIISRTFNCIYSLAKWPLGVILIVSSVLIALSLFNIVSMEKLRIAPQLFSLLVAAFEICIMGLICYIGQQMSDLSEDLTWELYSINWMEYSKEVNTSILIMKEYLKKPMLLKAAGISVVNVETFSTIMSTAYSYLNLLLASFHERQ